MKLVAFEDLTEVQLAGAAWVLREAFAHIPAYQDPGEAAYEVSTFLTDPDRFAIAAVEDGEVIGMIGGIRSYSHGLELHALAVDPPRQGGGVGAALVAALETRAAQDGKLTIYLGTDDEFGGTSLFGQDVYPDPLAALATITPGEARHPFFFYRKLGYVAVGIFPDANGFGKPDIFMAKRISAPE